jgi:hypothetical protein
MIKRIYTIAVSGILLLASSLYATDLSRYREFQLDSDLPGVARQGGMEAGDAKILHQRPAEIQELSWRGDPADSVKGIAFTFYNGALFRMAVDYDRYNTEGLTAQDMIAAISTTYGTALDPSTEITVPSVYGGDESVKVLARWEDSKWSFNLVRFKYEPSFTLVAFSKDLNEEARVAIDEAVRLDQLEAPQRAMERRSNEDEAKRLLQEKARMANRPDFRP